MEDSGRLKSGPTAQPVSTSEANDRRRRAESEVSGVHRWLPPRVGAHRHAGRHQPLQSRREPTPTSAAAFCPRSIVIFTGTRCTIFVKLPVALSGAMAAQADACGWRKAIDMALDIDAGEAVYPDTGTLTRPHVRNLVLLEVRHDVGHRIQARWPEPGRPVVTYAPTRADRRPILPSTRAWISV